MATQITSLAQLVEAHRAQLQHTALPESLWTLLFQKITQNVYDGGNFFTFVYQGDDAEPRERYKVAALRAMEPESDVFLVSHPWRFQTVSDAAGMLAEYPPLLERMVALTGLTEVDSDAEEDVDGLAPPSNAAEAEGAGGDDDGQRRLVDLVVDQLMYHAYTLKIQTAGGGAQDGEGEQVIHFVQDELGTRFRFSRTPNFHTIPLFYLGDGSTLSVYWPVAHVAEGDECTRPPAKRLQHLDHPDQRAYWSTRFEAETEFDWYASYATLRDVVRAHAAPGDAVLVLGCGTSTLSADMAADGFSNLHSVDFAANVIEDMRARHPELRWSVGDATNLEDVPADSVDVVLDKGCIDSMLATTNPEAPWLEPHKSAAVGATMAEMHRVLRPGGRMLVVSVARPESRTALFSMHEGHWALPPTTTTVRPGASAKAYEQRDVHVHVGVNELSADSATAQ